MHLPEDQGQRRRRGEELESALLDATWDELAEVGYGALTIDAVAQRAGTSRTVVYRRWATRRELVEAAVVHVSDKSRTEPSDTGSLRGDLITLMRDINERRIGLMALLVVYLGGYFQETGTTPYDLRRLVLERGAPTIDVIFERAVARGEVAAERLTPRVRAVPSDLFRHEAMMRLGPVPEEVVVSIVDEVFLPLATGSVTSAP